MRGLIFTTLLVRRAALVVGLLLLAVVIGMLWRDDRDGLNTPAEADAGCPTAATPIAGTGGVARFADTESRARVALISTSIVGYRDLYDLTWNAQWIIRGRVVADCAPPGRKNARTSMETSGQASVVIVQVDQIYRGIVMRTIAVAKYGDPMSRDTQNALQVGEDVMLFLGRSDQGFAWPLGASQGIWRVMSGRVAPASGAFPTLTLAEFPRAIAGTLRDQPAPVSRNIISLTTSPPGPDLPSGDVEPPSGCGGIVPSLAQRLEGTSDLAWVSDQIVFGTVAEREPSVVVEQPIGRADRALRPLVTDSIIQVDQRLRGQPLASLRVRQLGGQTGDCVVQSTDAPAMVVGDRVLLFLTQSSAGAAEPIFFVVGGPQGFWRANAGSTLISQESPRPDALPQVLPSSGMAARILAILTGEPPGDEWGELDPVSLESAPIGKPNLPHLAPGANWSVLPISAAGDSVRQPPGWTTFPNGPGGIVSLTSWPASARDEILPAGGMRVDIRRIARPSRPDRQLLPSDWPFGAGQADYPATISYASAYDPSQPDPPEQVYWVTVRYEVDDAIWEVRASLKQRPDLASSDLLTLFAILSSVEHAH